MTIKIVKYMLNHGESKSYSVNYVSIWLGSDSILSSEFVTSLIYFWYISLHNGCMLI
jgi:hypothetical protein